MRPLLLCYILFATLARAQAPLELVPSRVYVFTEEDEAAYRQLAAICDSLFQNTSDVVEQLPETRDLAMECDLLKEDLWQALPIGCSWYCGGGPQRVTASHEGRGSDIALHDPEHAHDLDFSTGWAGEQGDQLIYHFDPVSPRITKIIVVNGLVSDAVAWQEHGRVKRLKVYVDDVPFALLHLEDERSEQEFELPGPIGNDPTSVRDRSEALQQTLRFEILELIPGKRNAAAVISEIYFDGIDVH